MSSEIVFAGSAGLAKDDGRLPIGFVHILVQIPPGFSRTTVFRLAGRLLTVSDGDDNTVEVSAHGVRSAELLAAVARLVARGYVSVLMEVLAHSRPAPGPAARKVADEHLFPRPPAYLPRLPAGVALLELVLRVPLALWSYDETRARNWLLRERKSAVTVLGAIVPMGAASAGGGYIGPSSSAAAGSSACRPETLQQWVRHAVEDLLEQQPPGGDRERYRLISCFRELPSVTRLYDTRGGLRNRAQGLPGAAAVAAREGDMPPQELQQQAQDPQPLGLPGPENPRAAGVEGGDGGPVPPSDEPAPAVAGAPPETGILELPAEVLELVMSLLGPLDLARLRATCTALADAGAAGGAVPGVRLTLFPHQRAAISWMIRREQAGAGCGPTTRGSACGGGGGGGGRSGCCCCGPSSAATSSLPQQQPQQQDQDRCGVGHPHNDQLDTRSHRNYHPGQGQQQQHEHQQHRQKQQQQQQQWRAEPCRHPMYIELLPGGGGGLGLWADVGSGELHTSPPPTLPELRGGFFCDEPGLGKTITALSLILKTLGQLPTAPPGAAVEWVPNREGRKVGFYTMGNTNGTTIGGGGGSVAAVNGGGAGGISSDTGSPLPLMPNGNGGAAAVAAMASPCGASRRSVRLAAAAASPTAVAMTATGTAVAAAATTTRTGEEAASPQQQQQQPSQLHLNQQQMQSPRKRRRVSAAGQAEGTEGRQEEGSEDEDEDEDGDGQVAKEEEGEKEEQPASPESATPSARQQRRPSPAPMSRRRSAPQRPPGTTPAPQSPTRQQQQRRRGGGGSPRGGGRRAGAGARAGTKRKRGGGASYSGYGSSDESEEQADDGDSSSDEDEEEEDSPSANNSSDGEYKPGRRSSSSRSRSRRGGRRGRGGASGSSGSNRGGKGKSGSGSSSRGKGGRQSGSGAGGEGADGEEGIKEEEAEMGQVEAEGAPPLCVQKKRLVWVLCEQCSTWRRLPEGTPAPSDGNPWFCHMHPLPESASCTAPREAYGSSDQFEDAPGYLRRRPADAAAGGGGSGHNGSDDEDNGDGGDDGRNVEFFCTTLSSVAEGLGLDARSLSCMPALRWLSGQDPASLASNGPGCMVPREIRKHSPQYETVFRSLDLVTVADGGAGGRAGGGGQRRRGGGAGGGGGGGRKQRGDGASVSAQHTWRTAPYMAKLVLDMQALASALSVLPCAPSSASASASRTYLSAATLVVLPATIIDHWLLQIRTHVARSALRVCVLDRIDPRVTPLTPSSLAWDYDLVITTFSSLSHGGRTAAVAGAAASVGSGRRGGGGGGATCGAWMAALSKVHWLRIILDEGHLLGATTAITNKLQAACGLRAERRWVMTGTPTPATHGSSAAYLQPLLAFLHHQPYGTNSATWQSAVQRPLDGCRPEGRRRLMALLRQVMIRACKSDLARLPALVRKVTLLDFEPQHAKSYNELVEVVRRNLLTSDWCDDAHTESLLSSRNGRWSRQMMNNVWLSCCVAGSTNSVVKEEDVTETLELLAERLGLPPPGEGLPGGVPVGPPWLPEGHPLRGVEEALRHGTRCQVCNEPVRQPMVTPCGHVACLDCTASDRERCPLPACRTPYVMQSVSDPARHKHNKAPKWPVPIELIEWQPVYHQEGATGADGGKWSITWQLTRSSKISHMLKRLWEIGAAPPLGYDSSGSSGNGGGGGGDGSGSDTDSPGGAAAPGGGDGAVSCGDVGSVNGAPPPPPPSAAAVADAAAALAAAGAASVGEGGGSLATAGARAGASASGGGGGVAGGVLAMAAAAPGRFVVRSKAIIFTQYGVHMQLIESSLMRANIPFAILTQVVGKEIREASLSRFQHDKHCGVLLMDQLGAVGLDLSFVSYVLLMEPLADFSLEQQVVSRAHRMGATKPVHVETLVMRGSAEEALLRLDRKTAAAPAAPAADAAEAGEAGEAGGSRSGGSGGGGGASGSGGGGGGGPRRVAEATADDPRVAEEHEGGVQVDRRALRNQLFMLMEKVRLGAAAAAMATAGGGGRGVGDGGGGGAGPSRPAAGARNGGGIVGRTGSAIDGGSGGGGGSAAAPSAGGTRGGSGDSTSSGRGRESRPSAPSLMAALSPPPGQQQQQPRVAAAAAAVAAAVAASSAGGSALADFSATTTAAAVPVEEVAAAVAAPSGAVVAAGGAPEGERPREPKRRRVRFAGEDED